jgi:hypothetical protein
MGAADDDAGHARWVDEHAGPVVRPYTVTHGRTQPTGTGTFDLITLIITVRMPTGHDIGLGPEHHTIVDRCCEPVSVAEVSAHLNVPLGTVRVLLSDLLERGLIRVQHPRPDTGLPDEAAVLRAVLNGLRAL